MILRKRYPSRKEITKKQQIFQKQYLNNIAIVFETMLQ